MKLFTQNFDMSGFWQFMINFMQLKKIDFLVIFILKGDVQITEAFMNVWLYYKNFILGCAF